MQNLEEISKDIIMIIDNLEYEKKEEKLLKYELLLNINRLLSSEEEYQRNIEILKNGDYIEFEELYNNNTFNKVKSDIMYRIARLNYREESKKIDKLELLINLNKFLSTQKEYYNNIRLLNNSLKTKHI